MGAGEVRTMLGLVFGPRNWSISQNDMCFGRYRLDANMHRLKRLVNL